MQKAPYILNTSKILKMHVIQLITLDARVDEAVPRI